MSGCQLSERRIHRWPAAVSGAGAAILLGCATTSAETRQVTYSCGEEPGLTVVFQGEVARFISTTGPAIELQRRPSGSRFWYESPTHSIRGEGRSLTYTVGRMVPIQCQEIGA